MAYKVHGRNAGGRGHNAAKTRWQRIYNLVTLFLQGASVGVELKRFAWLGLALLVVEKKWGCSRKSGNHTTGTPHRSSPRLWGGARQFVSGFFFSNA